MSINIIMNPPYDGNLHLQILDKVIRTFPEAEIVNLSPIRWLQDPLAEYKKASDFKRFPKIREHIESLDEIGRHNTNGLFGILSETIGIYKLSKNGKGVDITHNKQFVDKTLEKMTTSLQTYIDHNTNGDFKLPVAKFHWTSNDEDWAPFTLQLSEDGVYAASGWTKGLHDTYEIICFKTENERNNCKAYLDNKVFQYILGQMFIGKRLLPQYIPFMVDYTKKWDDTALREYFDITDEEWKEIEGTVTKL